MVIFLSGPIIGSKSLLTPSIPGQRNSISISIQIFRFAVGVGGAANKNDRKFLGFAPRELVEHGRGASVIRQNPADFVRNTFELRPIHTAKIRNQKKRTKRGRRFAPTPLCIQKPFSKICGVY